MTTTEITKGQRVTILPTVHGMALDPTFPGWGAPDYQDHLVPANTLAGQQATITAVNHHGSYPWTRYCLHTDDGHHLIDHTPGNDFTTTNR